MTDRKQWHHDIFCYIFVTQKTRMHSSRMRTVRCSSHLGGCVSAQGVSAWGVCTGRDVCLGGLSAWGCLLRGFSARGGCLPREVCPGGMSAWGLSTQGVSAQGECLLHTPPLWTESQMPMKTLPCNNYVADGNNWKIKGIKHGRQIYQFTKVFTRYWNMSNAVARNVHCPKAITFLTKIRE